MTGLPPLSHLPPRVLVVTPSFNQRQYIEATIRSVASQDYSTIVHRIVDGQSTDGTCEVLRKFDRKVIISSEPDAGQADAINKGFSDTAGDILAWLNSDDTYEAGAVSAAVQYLNDHPDVALVYGDANFIDAGGNLIRRCAHIEPFNHHRLLHYSDFIVQPAAFFRRDAFEAVGRLDASLHYAMDYDLWLKIAQRFKVAYMPRVLANYRWFGENKSAVGGWERIEEVERVARRYGVNGLPAYFRLEKVNLYLQRAADEARRRDFLPAAGSMMRAASTALSSWGAVRSLLSSKTWRIIQTGRVLRSIHPTTT